MYVYKTVYKIAREMLFTISLLRNRELVMATVMRMLRAGNGTIAGLRNTCDILYARVRKMKSEYFTARWTLCTYR